MDSYRLTSFQIIFKKETWCLLLNNGEWLNTLKNEKLYKKHYNKVYYKENDFTQL
jgi:hypothetical protein